LFQESNPFVYISKIISRTDLGIQSRASSLKVEVGEFHWAGLEVGSRVGREI
jgi:hypothetical protein